MFLSWRHWVSECMTWNPRTQTGHVRTKTVFYNYYYYYHFFYQTFSELFLKKIFARTQSDPKMFTSRRSHGKRRTARANTCKAWQWHHHFPEPPQKSLATWSFRQNSTGGVSNFQTLEPSLKMWTHWLHYNWTIEEFTIYFVKMIVTGNPLFLLFSVIRVAQ